MSQTITGSSGADTLNGFDGDDIFHFGLSDHELYKELQTPFLSNEAIDIIFNSSIGHNIIKDFEGAGATQADLISLDWHGFSSITDILSAISYHDNNAIISIDNENSITLIDIAANSLTHDDFVLV